MTDAEARAVLDQVCEGKRASIQWDGACHGNGGHNNWSDVVWYDPAVGFVRTQFRSPWDCNSPTEEYPAAQVDEGELLTILTFATTECRLS